jgi:serine/threonine-protein kinase
VTIQEGEVLGGKYRVERVLATGGMGVIVAARHLQLDQRVALKFLLPDAGKNPEVVARFSREARAAARIRGQHVARVSDVGTLESGQPYMVMEYLEGQDLEAILKTRGALPVEEAVHYVIQACEAVAEAHSVGIVHRDLKPANLYLADRPGGGHRIKVLDFGISKVAAGEVSVEDASLTKTNAIMGSPTYMSPEQLRSSRDVDARSDIWSIGVVLYELVGGRVPFCSDTIPEVCASILKDPPVPLSAMCDVPEALEAAIFRCLEKEAGARFATIAELVEAIVEFGPRGSEASLERIRGFLQRPAAERVPEPPKATPLEQAATIIDRAGPPTRREVPTRVEPREPTPTQTTAGTEISMPLAPPAPWQRWRIPALAGITAVALGLLLLLTQSKGAVRDPLQAPVASAFAGVGRDASATVPAAAPEPEALPPEPVPAPTATVRATAPSAAPRTPAPAPSATARPSAEGSGSPSSTPSASPAASVAPGSSPTGTANPSASAARGAPEPER